MRVLKVTYRSIQEQPTGVLNPGGYKLPGPRPVEVFCKGTSWYVREIETAKRVVYEKLGTFPSAQAAMDSSHTAFASMREAWQMWGEPPLSDMQRRDHSPVLRLIGPHEVTILATGVVCWKEPEDFTHIMHTGPNYNTDGNAKTFRSCCEEMLTPKHFVSTKANIQPTCTACAEVWSQEYKGK